MAPFLQDSDNICRLGVSYRLELLAVGGLEMRAHVISTVAQADLEILVAEDLFLLAKDGVCELGVEGRNVLEARLRRRDEADIDGIVGVGQP